METNLKKMLFYCDESCHLKNDNSNYMVLAAVYCTKNRVRYIVDEIRKIKTKYNINANTELKWNKVSPVTLDMYKEIFAFIKNYKKLKIRVIVANKAIVNDIDEWYYKMYYSLLVFPIQSILLNFSLNEIVLYTDIKDSHSYSNMDNVKNFLQSHFNSQSSAIIRSVICDSQEVSLIQIADLIAGAASYINRNLKTSSAKLELAKYIQKTFNISFTKTTKTSYGTISNYNVFIWDPKDIRGYRDEF